jgi:hypothetical protein
MRRQLTGLALSTLLLAGCASKPVPQAGGLYHAPARAYSLSLDSAAFRGGVTLTEQCDKNGGTLNIWDSANRFFRIDYLKTGEHPMADVPSFASERTVTEQVLANYLRDVLPDMPEIDDTQTMIQEFVDTGRGSGMFAVIGLKMKRSALPEGVTNARYFYGFLVFTRGDMVYVVQHRADTYQPDNMKTVLSGLRQDMLVPGVLRPVGTVEDPSRQCG